MRKPRKPVDWVAVFIVVLLILTALSHIGLFMLLNPDLSNLE